MKGSSRTGAWIVLLCKVSSLTIFVPVLVPGDELSPRPRISPLLLLGKSVGRFFPPKRFCGSIVVSVIFLCVFMGFIVGQGLGPLVLRWFELNNIAIDQKNINGKVE